MCVSSSSLSSSFFLVNFSFASALCDWATRCVCVFSCKCVQYLRAVRRKRERDGARDSVLKLSFFCVSLLSTPSVLKCLVLLCFFALRTIWQSRNTREWDRKSKHNTHEEWILYWKVRLGLSYIYLLRHSLWQIHLKIGGKFSVWISNEFITKNSFKSWDDYVCNSKKIIVCWKWCTLPKDYLEWYRFILETWSIYAFNTLNSCRHQNTHSFNGIWKH